MSKIRTAVHHNLRHQLGALLATAILAVGSGSECAASEFNFIDFDGASNTAGLGASLSLDLRVKSHLSDQHQNLQVNEHERIMIAIDYFFPTRFSELENLEERQIETQVEKVVRDWLRNHTYVLVGELPTVMNSQVNKNGKDTIPFSSRGSLAFILNFLKKTDVLKRNTLAVNRVLKAFSETDQRVHLLKFSDVALALSNKRLNDLSLPSESSMFSDSLHFNDLGQAFLYNVWLQPELMKILNVNLDPMKYVQLSKEQKMQVILKQSHTPADFLEKKSGAYWMNFVDPKAFQLNRAQLIIPAQIMNDQGGKDTIISLENFDRVQAVIDRIKNKTYRDGVIELAGVGVLALQLNEPGFFVEVNSENGSSFITPDFSRVLSYMKIKLPENGSTGEYSGQGYDFWFSATLSQAWYQTLFWRNWMSFIGWIPSVNYKFKFTRVEGSPRLNAQWQIIQRLGKDGAEQPKVMVRSPFVEKPWGGVLDRDSSKFPRLIYDFAIEVPSR